MSNIPEQEERDGKILLEICVGITCYVLGASELQSIEEFLPEDLAGKVEITGSPCLGFCRNRNDNQAPFVRINKNVVVKHATIDSVIEALRKVAAEKAL